MSNRMKFILLFLSLFVFRTAFGLSQPFFSDDELQTYLIGLKCYTTGTWPYFGPDLIVTETGFYSQIPGALEGLLAGLPFQLLPIPEAPFLLLNLLSLSSLALLSWYIAKRLPEIPFPFIFIWVSLLPWNLHESANVLNPAYLLFGSILFFIGLLEAIPAVSLRWLSSDPAFALMGFGIFWNMQFHFSWILLPPFVLCALLLRWRAGQRGILREAVGFLVGAAFPAAFLVPTLFKYGFLTGKGGLSLFQSFNGHNFLSFFDILARFFSLASYELLRFLELPHLTGSGTAARIAFCKSVPWIIPPVLFLILTGWIQPLALFIGGWFKDIRHPEAKPFQRLTLGALLLVWASFWFTSKPPSAHIYYILLPLILIYSFYIGARLAAHHKWRALGVACLVANLWFESGYMWQMMRIQSLYVNRAKVIQAIHERNYHVLGERRPGSLY